MRVVIRHPVHLPVAKQKNAGPLDHIIIQCEARLLLQDDFADIARVHRHPAIAIQIDLSATMLGFRNITALAKTLKTQLRSGYPHTIDVACWDADGAAKTDKQGIEVSTFAAKILGLQHRLDVASATAAGCRVAERILNDPLINSTRLLMVPTAHVFDDRLRRLPYNAVGR